MSEQRYFVLSHDQARYRAAEFIKAAPEGWIVRVSPPSRTLEQNSAQFGILQAFSEQLEWPVNGHMVNLSAEEFKDILSAAFQNETVRLAQGLDGGVVMLGLQTSKMTKSRFSEWLEFLNSVAAQRGVVVYPDDAR